MQITPAKANEIAGIVEILKDARKHLESQLIFQWHDEYPSVEIVAEDVNNGHLYSCQVEGDCAGIMTLSEVQDPEYAGVAWEDASGRPLVIHRLVVKQAWQGKGVGDRLLEFANLFAFQNKYSSLRLDVYSGNRRAMRFYERNGFLQRGEVRFPKRQHPFFCYEKKVETADQ
jgi:ribosomal protein S18 acetylase RimI-like enzyme